jgi:hypothetical protein
MATLLDLTRGASPPLVRYDPQFERGAQEFRCFVASQHLQAWMAQSLPGMTSGLGLELSPQEQVFALLSLFCSDDPLTIDRHFKPLHCRGQGVWELRTPDVRIFGWFPQKDHFVGVEGNDATFIKQHDLYPGYIGAVTRFRDTLDLDEPKFITSTEPRDVVSNYNYT